jgi:hypothetical protein
MASVATLCDHDSYSGIVARHPFRFENRLGFRLANADCRRTGIRRLQRRRGLGWYIFQNRNELFTDRVFAGLLTVIAIGLLVEGIVFASLEKITIKRWGMQR